MIISIIGNILLLISIGTLSVIFNHQLKRKSYIITSLQNDIETIGKNLDLSITAREWQDKIDCLKYEYKDRQIDEKVLEQSIADASKMLYQIQESTKELTNDYDNRISSLENQYNIALENFKNKNNLAKEQIKNDNIKFLSEQSSSLTEDMAQIAEYFQNKIQICINEYNKYQENFLAAKRDADLAVAAALNKQKEQEEIDFFRIQLSPQDVKEVAKLKEIASELRNPEPLNKVIWKVYYQTPTGEMIKRVLGTGIKCGIYKITHIDSEKSYIGQSVNIAERYKQHIRRGLGADPITRNKLYPAMNSLGPENFTFSLLEECPREQLNDREKFWINYYQTYDFGYNDTNGG